MRIAIASGKGGTGKTTLSVNLSSLIAEKFEGTENKVLLTDMDVEEPNSGLFFKGELEKEEIKYRMVPQWDAEKCTFCKRCANVCEYNALAFLGVSVLIFPELCHSCYACSDLCPEDALPMVKHRMGEMKQYKLNDHLKFVESRIDVGIEQATPLGQQHITDHHRRVSNVCRANIQQPSDLVQGANHQGLGALFFHGLTHTFHFVADRFTGKFGTVISDGRQAGFGLVFPHLADQIGPDVLHFDAPRRQGSFKTRRRCD